MKVENIRELAGRIHLRTREKSLLALLGFSLLFIGYYKPIYLPKATDLRGLKARYLEIHRQKVKVESELPDAEAYKKKIDVMKTAFEEAEKQLLEIENQLPDETQISEVLAYLSSSTEKLNIKMETIKPLKVETLTTKGVLTEAEMDQARARQQQDKGVPIYKILPIEVYFSASLDDMLKYMARLEKAAAYLKVRDYKMRIDQSGAGAPEIMLMAQVLLTPPKQAVKDERREVFATLNKMVRTIAQDPFNPVTKPLETGELADMDLQGIMWKKGRPTAIINGESCVIGDVYRGKKIAQITQDMVVMEEKGRRFTLKLQEGL